MSSFDETGLQVDRLPEILEALIANFKSLFGEGNEADKPLSVSGQTVSLWSTAQDSSNELVQASISAYDPTQSKGVHLSRLVKLNGMTRKENVYSTVALEVTADVADLTIFAGDLVSDQAENFKWAIDSEVVVPANTSASISATCTKEGSISAAQDTITKIITKRYSWLSVNNPASSTIGRTEETDTALRRRRNQVATSKSSCSGPRLENFLFETENVAFAKAFYNPTEVIDSDGIPPGGAWFIVKGGSDTDIAETIATNAAPTTQYKGDVSTSYVDEYGKAWPVKYDRPDDIDVYMYLYMEVDDTFPRDGIDQIKQKIFDYFGETYGIGSKVIYSRAASAANEVPGHSIKNYLLSFNNPPGENDKNDLTVQKFEQAVILKDSIVVETYKQEV